ncbi:unnamed protein product [Euphydryas editha]|uniref:Uncharacterized protein n=1 Tax=Euphydryas editha TaxID=104508 RepID=A0AAU9UZH8_EUPED|nr:unnamed protein product [Euphydryas editha]
MGQKVGKIEDWFDENDEVLMRAFGKHRHLLRQQRRSNRSANTTEIRQSERELVRLSRKKTEGTEGWMVAREGSSHSVACRHQPAWRVL